MDRLEARLYHKLSVKLYGKGVEVVVAVDGSTVLMKRHQLARPGQVIVSEIWAKKGAVGIVPEEGAGALCTSHFFLFDLDVNRASTAYLDVIFRANLLERQLGKTAHGTTSYAAVRPSTFLEAQIPLPNLRDQRALTDRLDQVSRAASEIRARRDRLMVGLSAMTFGLIAHSTGRALEQVALSEILSLRQPDVVVQPDETYHFAGVYSFGRGVFAGAKKSGRDFAYSRLTRLRAGNFIYPKLMAWEGAMGAVPADCAGLVVSPEFPVFEVDTSRVLPEVLDVFFRFPATWKALGDGSTGTNLRRRRLHPTAFLQMTIPLPPKEAQERLVEVRRRSDAVETLLRQSAGALESLPKSILRSTLVT